MTIDEAYADDGAKRRIAPASADDEFPRGAAASSGGIRSRPGA
ncbi:MAG: hypothetical protein ACM3ML_19935 [Micromonosporaceae bacterium]